MTYAQDIPVWVAILVSLLMLLGAALALIGSCGFWRLPAFYARIHAPTLGTSWGAGGIIFASMLLFSMIEGRPVLHEILLGVFVTVTTPVTLMLLSRAALYRDRAEGNPAVPDVNPPRGVLHETDGTDDTPEG